MLGILLLVSVFLIMLKFGAISSHAVFSYEDVNDDKGKNANYVGTTVTLSALDALVTALQAGSNAAMTRRSITIFATESDTETDDMYKTVADKAVFEFVCSTTGEYVRVSVPAPDDTLFKTNQKEVDPAAVLSAAIITQVIAVVTSNSGAPVTGFVKGWREER